MAYQELKLTALVLAVRLEGGSVELMYSDTGDVTYLDVDKHRSIAKRQYSRESFIRRAEIATGSLQNTIMDYLESHVSDFDFLSLDGIHELKRFREEQMDISADVFMNVAKSLVVRWTELHHMASRKHVVMNQETHIKSFIHQLDAIAA